MCVFLSQKVNVDRSRRFIVRELYHIHLNIFYIPWELFISLKLFSVNGLGEVSYGKWPRERCNSLWSHNWVQRINVLWSIYRQTSNISCTLVGYKILDHSDVVGASPVGAASNTSLFSTLHLASMDWANTLQDNTREIWVWDVLRPILEVWWYSARFFCLSVLVFEKCNVKR